jgi:hypothetical protein
MTEPPAGFDQSFPGGLVDRTRERESARTLERLDEGDGAVAVSLRGVIGREMTEGSETLV